MSSDLLLRQDDGAHKRLLWRRLDAPGLEYSEFGPLAQPGWRMMGHVITVTDGFPAHLRYVVACDARWQTLTTRLSIDMPGKPTQLILNHEEGGLALGPWSLDGEQQPALADCIDVDLGFSPVTNTLPVRRLGLAVGEAREITAAWVRFPELDVVPMRQRYTRLAERLYRYQNVESEFTADLTLDDDGLVVTYPGIWERVTSI
jgi:hypothetical protein